LNGRERQSALYVGGVSARRGWRPRDLDLAYLPFLRGKGIAQYTSDPVFRDMLYGPGDGSPERSPQINLAALRTLIELTRPIPIASSGRCARAGAEPRWSASWPSTPARR